MSDSESKHPETLDMDNRDFVAELRLSNERMQSHIESLASQLTTAISIIEGNSTRANDNPVARFRLPLPPKFSGRRGDLDPPAEEWLFSCEQHLEAVNRQLVPKQVVLFIGSLLTDLAASWYLSYCRQIVGNNYDYNHFRTAFLAEFRDILVVKRARDRLRAIRQGDRPIYEYVSEFRTILRQIHDMSPPDQIHSFIHGLRNIEVRRDVEIRDPQTLEDAIVMSSTYANHLDRASKYHGFPASQNNDQMDLDNLSTSALGVESVYELAAMILQQNPVRASQFKSRTYRKLTPQQKQYLIRNKGCFYCRKANAGHVASNCPSKKMQGNEYDQ